MIVSCFVVDDEPLARSNLISLLGRHASIHVRRSLGDAREALRYTIEDPPDLILLDVKLPGLSGIEFLDAMEQSLAHERLPYVVLVTAYDTFAVEAFDYGAIDYLVKPVDVDRFDLAMARAERRIVLRRSLDSDDAALVPEPPLLLSAGPHELLLPPREICWVETRDHYLTVHTRQRSHLVRFTMTAIARLLEPHGFLRVHRTALVNPAHVRSTEPKPDGGRFLRLEEGSRVPVSRHRWPEIRASLARHD